MCGSNDNKCRLYLLIIYIASIHTIITIFNLLIFTLKFFVIILLYMKNLDPILKSRL